MPTRRPQLRRCRTCQKVGHNASTCSVEVALTASVPTPEKPPVLKTRTRKSAASQARTSSTTPLKFYVHHVTFEPRHSPHVVNLKEQKFNVWDQVTAAAPTLAEEESLYHFHHKLNSSSTPNTSLTPLPGGLANQIHNPALKGAEEGVQVQKESARNLETTPLFVNLKNTAPELNPAAPPPSSFQIAKTAPWWSKFKTPASEQTSLSLPKLTTFSKPSPSFSLRKVLDRYFALFTFSKNSSGAQPETASQVTQFRSPTKRVPWRERSAARWQSFSASFFNGSVLRKRLAFALAALLVISILPTHVRGYYYDLEHTKQMVADTGTAGFMSLQESTAALLSANLTGAQESTINALQNFNTAIKTLENNHQLLQKIISVVPILKDEVQSRQALIEAGYKISLGNTYLLKGLATTEQDATRKPAERLQIIVDHLQAAIPKYEGALTNLNKVKTEALPPEFQAPFKDFKTIFTAAVTDFRQLVSLGQNFREIFGGEGLRRYALMFQNPDELRATGGFTGSFAIIDVKNGELIKMDVPPGGTYAIQGQLDKYVEPPTPFLLFTKGYWQFHDANWFPHFPASAENIMWFYRHTGRGSLDGVIAVNSTFLTRLLSLIGPIKNDKQGITLTADNALTTLRKAIDTTNASPANAASPKQVITDLAPQFAEYFKTLKPGDILPLLVNLKDALDQKEIQLYFTNKETEEKISSFGWGGALTPTLPMQDYLNVNITNINGGKTDARIEQHITHQAVVEEDGSVVDTVVISRTHHGLPTEELYNRPNSAYFRIYVPEGSTLLNVSGVVQPNETAFHPPVQWAEKYELLSTLEKEVGNDAKTGTRITTEFGKTAFGNWIVTKPGETTRVQISYRLPFQLFDPTVSPSSQGLQSLISSEKPNIAKYQLALQRQSGLKSSFESQIIFPTSWQPLWNEGTNLDLAANGATIAKMDLLHDMIWSLAMEHHQ